MNTLKKINSVSFALRSIIISMSLVVIFFAVQHSLANLYANKVQVYLSRWETSNKVESIELNDALIAVSNMLYLHGQHPRYLNLAGRVFEWKAFSQFGNKDKYQSALAEAKKLYLMSSIERPEWPGTWISLLEVNLKLGIINNELYHYLSLAESKGKNAKEIIVSIARIQLIYWELLPLEFRAKAVPYIVKALSNDATFNLILHSARLNIRTHVLCILSQLHNLKAYKIRESCRK